MIKPGPGPVLYPRQQNDRMLGYGHSILLERDMNTSLQTSQHLLEKVWRSLRQKDIRQAINDSNLLVQKFPGFAAGWHAASHVAQLIKQPDSALTAIDRALKLESGNTSWQLHRASCLLMCGENEDAGRLLQSLASDSDRFQSSQLSELAFLCSRLEMHDEAAQIYLTLIQQEPTNGGHWYNLASIQRFQGEIAQAEASLDKAIGFNRKDYEAYELRSDLRKQNKTSNHIEQLQNLIKNGIDIPAGEVQICYALAKELEDTGDSNQSFDSLTRGANLRRKHINYSITDDLQTIDAIIETFNSTVFKGQLQGHLTREPIFVIGLPRTGTTLVERILGSHSGVFAAGELNNFAVQLMQQVSQQSGRGKLTRRQLVQQTARLDYELVGKAYLDSSRPVTGKTPHFADKMPLNFLYAGLIHLALPQARIIHLTRHPMDTCYAIYKRLFKDGYPWSYDLEEIASYYLAYRRLMEHWNTVMPGVIFELAYEDLVMDFELQARGLIEACELPWESQCLHFNENTGTTTTASASQVRQPVYTSSVNRWRDYQQQLTPLAEKLIEGGIQLD